ncbi:MAG: TrkH family potassium uptake protein [Gemmatimonadota bacterium]|nr:TrkH family potassium uptake protein [Gemmatimonadota bacterium]MDH5195881.1 TrkH family potassium uptake protein [Gemmatimonadota bacterium]
MNPLEVLRVIGVLLVATAAAMVPSVALAVPEGLLAGWLGAAVLVGGAGAVAWIATPRIGGINAREGVVIVGLGWVAVVIAGSLPFIFTGVAPSVSAALFESVSGFTTTGATVFAVIEDLPPSALMWRSMSHWIGGMGIIVLGVAILPLLGVGGAQLFRAEVPGITADRLAPRIVTTARLLWGVYVFLTGLLVVLYMAFGMSPFEAINHAMSTLATGGFSTRTASLGAFSPAIQWITVFFMFAAGVNFTLHYRMLTGRWNAWFRDAEWRWYLASTVGVSLAAFAALWVEQGNGSLDLLRHAVFNVVSIHSTTGFATADFALWPSVAQVLLLGLMFVGAMGGSTGGGFKVVRAAVVTEHTRGEIMKVLHPRAIVVTRLGRTAVRSEVVLNVLAFLGMYVATHAAGTIALAALGSDLVTAMSAALAAMSSIGPGLAGVGPAANYGHLGDPALLVLSALMLLGRLEFYTLLVLFLPGVWMRAGGRR